MRQIYRVLFCWSTTKCINKHNLLKTSNSCLSSSRSLLEFMLVFSIKHSNVKRLIKYPLKKTPQQHFSRIEEMYYHLFSPIPNQYCALYCKPHIPITDIPLNKTWDTDFLSPAIVICLQLWPEYLFLQSQLPQLLLILFIYSLKNLQKWRR